MDRGPTLCLGGAFGGNRQQRSRVHNMRGWRVGLVQMNSFFLLDLSKTLLSAIISSSQRSS